MTPDQFRIVIAVLRSIDKKLSVLCDSKNPIPIDEQSEFFKKCLSDIKGTE